MKERLISLLLRPHPARRAPGDVAGVVEWFGAMQAQDMASVLWSLGVRLPGSTLTGVNAELERREVLRTWPMRGTVHLVPAADARWMLELMGVRMLAGAEKRRETIGLTRAEADRGVEVLAAALKGNRLTRAECLAAVAAAGLGLAGQQGYHLLWYASQLGVTAIAPHVGKEQTFVLLDEWAPAPNQPERDEALGIVALRYFRSHGPATRADLVRWTGLTVTDVKKAIAVAGDRLVALGDSYVDAELAGLDPEPDDDWDALPGFDEYMLGYRDRSAFLAPEHLNAVVPGGNGVFRSTLVRGGRTVGTWTRTLTRKAVVVEVHPLAPFGAADKRHAVTALEPYARFLELPLEVRWAS